MTRFLLNLFVLLIVLALTRPWTVGTVKKFSWVQPDNLSEDFIVCFNMNCKLVLAKEALQPDHTYMIPLRMRPGTHSVGVIACNTTACSSISRTEVVIPQPWARQSDETKEQ